MEEIKKIIGKINQNQSHVKDVVKISKDKVKKFKSHKNIVQKNAINKQSFGINVPNF